MPSRGNRRRNPRARGRGATGRKRRVPSSNNIVADSVDNGKTEEKDLTIMEIAPTVTVKELANITKINPIEIIKQLMRNGVMATINQTIDYDAAALIGAEIGFDFKQREIIAEEIPKITEELQEIDTNSDQLETRPPIVTMLGHVDHGKTTLLDTIRKVDVAGSEVGGITQHMGAYQIEYKDQKITFIDTPGHEAFTAMRARGAHVTDIAVLVVAGDDGVMPQTTESIDHAKAADIPIIVVISKIDKPAADVEKVKTQLSQLNLVAESWGGDTIVVPVSAKDGSGLDDLLENILAVAEIQDIKANSAIPAVGVIVESRLDQGKGPTATVLVKHGVLKVGDIVVAGNTWGRVKALLDDTGLKIGTANPSTPIEIMGFNSPPIAGDTLTTVKDEKAAKEIVSERITKSEDSLHKVSQSSLEDMSSRIQTGEADELSLILKTDVHGTAEAIAKAIKQIDSKSNINIIHSGLGSITATDILLAVASKAIIAGFNTRIEPGAKKLARQEGVDVRLYDIIYKLVEDIEKAGKGLLAPVYHDVVEGHAKLQEIFSVGRKIKVAGCLVTEGKISQASTIKITRSDKEIFEGPMAALMHFKDTVKEVMHGNECGISIEGFNEWEEGDLITSVTRELSHQ